MKKRTLKRILYLTPVILIFIFILITAYLKTNPPEDGYNLIATYIKRRRLSKVAKIVEQNKTRKEHILKLSQALEDFKKEKGHYPSDPIFANSFGENGIFSTDLGKNPLVPEYISTVLRDPINTETKYSYDYIYLNNEYLLYAKLEPEKEEEDKLKEEFYCIDSFTVNKTPIIIDFNPFFVGQCTNN